MTFGQPLWFWAFVLFPVLLLFFAQNERRREKLLRLLVAARLQDRLAGTVSVGRRRFRFFVLLLGLACVIMSLAQPRIGYTWEQSKRKGRDVIIAIDCSRSMLATDLAPSRLGRAKLAAQDFIGQLKGDRIGLIAFAGSAFLQAPLTIDYGAVLNSLAELDTTIIPRGGTNIAAAITEADAAFGKGESDNRCLILFTDGEELDADGQAAAESQKDRIKIFTVGLGSPDGSLIPLPGEGGGAAFVKDAEGQIVKSKLDEDRLRKIAEVTGGFYVHLQNGPTEMQRIIRDGLGQMKEQEIDARMSRRPIERYQWPLAAGLVLLVGSTLISERKRPARRSVSVVAKAVVVLLLAICGTGSARAEWKNPGVEMYQKGQEPLKRAAELEQQNDAETAQKEFATAKKEFEGAYQQFAKQLQRRPDSPELNFNLGAAAYKLGKNDEALLAFGKATLTENPKLRVDAESNIGSTLYRKGVEKLKQGGAAKMEESRKEALKDWKDGLKHYDDALKVQPDNQLVQGYREFLRRQIEELEKEPPKSDENQKSQDNKDNKDDKKDKEDKKQDQQQSKGGKSDKDQQEKNKDQQQQQQDQQSQDSKDQQPQNQPKDGQDKQPQSQDQKDQKDQDGKQNSGQQKKDEKGDEKKDAKNDPSKDGQNNPAPQQDKKPGQQPPPPDGEPEKKRDGEIQPAQGNPQPSDPQQEAAAEAQAAAEGKMTEAQARTLLESLKGEDDRVQLLKPNDRRPGRAFRDW